jgi:CRP-like cAMP-binding protein
MDDIRTYFNRFIELTDEEWRDFGSCLQFTKVDRGSLLLSAGEQCDFLAFIEQGLFRFYTLRDGEEKITGFFFSGDFVSNYRSFLTGQPLDHYIEAMQDSVVHIICHRDLQALYDRYKNMERLGRFISEQLYLTVASRLDSFMFDAPSERYLALQKRNSKLLEEIPQYMIASYLGVKPETLSRIRARR